MADRSLILRIRADLAQAKAAVTGFISDLRSVGDTADRQAGAGLKRLAKSARDNRAEWEQLGRTLTGFGAAGVAAMGLSAKAAIDWESAFAGVKKTVDDSAEGYASLSRELRDMALVLPASHSEIAGVAEAAGQLGIQRGNITSFTRSMIDLGEATNLSADEAATALARFANIMGTSQDEFSNVGSAVVDLGNNFATTEREIVEMGLRLAGAGRQARLSEGEVLGLATALSSVGIEAEAGGTAFSKVIIEMSKAVDTGSAELETFAEVAGMTTEEFARAWEDNAGAALAAFIGGLGDLDAAGQSIQPILEDLGMTDIRVGDALRRSSSAADLFTEAMNLGNEAYAENVALTKEAEQRYATVESQLGMMRNAISDAAISFGETLMPAIQGVTGLISDFATWLANLPKPAQATIAVVGGVGSAAALAAGGFMLMVPRIVETVDAMRRLGLITPRLDRNLGKIGKAAGVAAGVIGGVGLLLALSETGRAMNDFSTSAEEAQQRLLRFQDTAALWSIFEQNAWAVQEFDEALREATKDDPLHSIGRSLGDLGDGLGALLGQDTRNNLHRFLDDMSAVDEAIANIAAQDMGQAQQMFRSMAEQTDGSRESLENLLKLMPGYETALMAAANEAGIAVDKHNMLAYAMGNISLEGSGMFDMLHRVLAEGLNRDVNPALEEHIELTQEAKDNYSDYIQRLSESGREFATLGGALDAYTAEVQEMAQAEADAYNATIEGTDKAAKSWEDFVDDSIFNLDRYKAHLEDLVEAQANWSGNMIYLAGRIPPAMLEELANLGPEAAPMIQALRDATDKELQEIVDLWEQAGEQAPAKLAHGIEYKQGLALVAAERLGEKAMQNILDKIDAGEITIMEALEDYDLMATLEVLADTDPAAAALLEYVKEVENTTATATLDADGKPAEQVVDSWYRDASRRKPTPVLNVDVGPARNRVDSFDKETRRRTTVVKVDATTKAADDKMREFHQSWTGKTIRFNISVGSSPGGNINTGRLSFANADGGIIRRADGGVDQSGGYVPRVSQFGGPAFGKTNVLWGEPETGWEAYISGKPSMRNRNIGIWEQAGRMLGVSFTRHANGAILPWTMNVGASKSLVADLSDHMRAGAKGYAENNLASLFTAARGDWRSLWNLVSPFGVTLFSALRPGARTATGFQSKHALGKAIDVSPSRALWNFLEPMKHAFAELYGPWGLWLRGENRWKYPGAAITARNHRDHIHIAAYANGGIKAADTGRLSLQPGLNAVYNGLNRTEHLQETLGRTATGAASTGPTFNITNIYPQAEPTSKTVQRASQHQAAAGRY